MLAVSNNNRFSGGAFGRTRHGFTNRGEAIFDAIKLHFQAELIEALEAPPGSRAAINPVARLVEANKSLTKRQRLKMSKRLRRFDMETGERLSPRKAHLIGKAVKPGEKTPMVKRSPAASDLSALLNIGSAADVDTPQKQHDLFAGLLADFQPIRTFDDSDGRPDDAEPGHGIGGTSRPTRVDLAIDLVQPREPRPCPYEKLDFIVESIVCLDTTNGEAGKDEISVSGATLTAPLSERNASDRVGASELPITDLGQFGNNDIKTNLPTPFATFDLTDTTMPRFCTVFFTMAETDPQGGFEEYMDVFGAEFRNFSVTGFAETPEDFAFLYSIVFALFATPVAGTAVGFVAGGPVGAVIGFIAGLVIGITTAWILAYAWAGGNKDEIFDPQQVTLFFKPRSLEEHPFYGGTRSVTESFLMEEDGGLYEVRFHFQLRDPIENPQEDADAS